MSKNIELLDGGVGVFNNILPATFVDSLTYIEQLKVIAEVLNQTVEVVNAIIEAGGSGYILPPATTEKLGGIKVGENLTITEDGTLSAAAGSEGVLSASVEQTEDGAVISITDKDGTTTATISNGSPGAEGPQGADGFSPTASVEQTVDGATITITDKTGTTTATVYNGTSASLTLGNGLKWVDGKLTLDLGQNLYFTEDGKLNATASEPVVVTTAVSDTITTKTTSKGTNTLSETMTANDNVEFITY